MDLRIASIWPQRRWEFVPVVTAVVVLFFLLVSYFTPANMNWLTSPGFSWSNLIRFVVLDQFVVELITFFILAWLVTHYRKALGLQHYPLGLRQFVHYLVRFLPLFAMAFFVINPFTQTARYLLHWVQGESPDYWHDYFYSLRLYLIYLTPLTLGGVLLVVLDVYYGRQAASATPQKCTTLEVADSSGKAWVPLESIRYFERKERKVLATTESNTYRVSHTLSELESMLMEETFVRANRSVIVNLRYFNNYSFWENDKFVLRLIGGKEFIISRDRLKKIKASLSSGNSSALH
ncbi:MAG: LytTR family transcriptional regulator [Bacteroidetes bacterium]|nr:LytTR family transcriptional regulator [Bacteroidota bacterium]